MWRGAGCNLTRPGIGGVSVLVMASGLPQISKAHDKHGNGTGNFTGKKFSSDMESFLC